jgi:hypothetical protein
LAGYYPNPPVRKTTTFTRATLPDPQGNQEKKKSIQPLA